MPIAKPLPRRQLLGLALSSLLTQPVWAEAAPLTDAEQAKVLNDLAAELEGNFVFPEIGQRYAAMLRDAARSQRHAALRDPRAFAAAVSADLQAVHADRHLVLRLSGEDPSPAGSAAPGTPRPRLVPLERAEMMGELAYLKVNLFLPDPKLVDALRSFLTGPAAQARALVIDARGHRGGSLHMMDALLPLIYAEPRTLVRMDTRKEAYDPGMTPSGPTLLPREAPNTLVRHDHVVTPDPKFRGLQRVPVYYLTSGRTASAAEHLALALKSSGRATLIGATTAGAGHFGGPAEFGRFNAFIPVGRTYDPQTGQDWEGRGIAPDVPVPPEQALDKALELAAAAGIKVR